MRKRIVLIILFVLSAYGAFCSQKEICFRQLKTSDGLSDNRVLSLGMSDDGVLCIRTDTKIDRYDGASFRHFAFETGRVMYNSYPGVFPLQFDRDGRMWLRNRDMIWGIDFRTGEWIYDVGLALGITEGEVKSLFIDSGKNLWFGVSGGDFYYADISGGGTFKICGPSMGIPRGMVDSKYLCWILFDDDVLRCYDKQGRRFVSEIPSFIDDTRVERLKMELDRNGNLWAMYNQGLVFLDTHTGVRGKINGIELHGSDLLTSMAVDECGNVWLGSTSSGLRIVDVMTMKARQIPLKLCSGEDVSSISGISDIYVDENGIVWVATSKEGILYYHDSLSCLECVNRRTVSGGEFEENVKAILALPDGNLILGTMNGVCEFDPETKCVSTPPWLQKLRNELCTGLYLDSRNRIWVATFQNGMFCVSPDYFRHYLYEKSLVHLNYYKGTPYLNSSRTFFEDNEGKFWVSVYGGIGRMDSEDGKIDLLGDRHPEISHIKFVRNILQMGDDELLIAADDCVFKYFPSKDSVVFNPDSQLFVGRITKHNCTIIDSRGLVWFGTHDGLSVYRKDGTCVVTFGQVDGIPENVLGVAEDGNGDIWISTPVAIVRIVVSGGEDGSYVFNTSLYDSDYGLDNGTFYEHSVAVGKDGKVYFGGTHGLTVVNPEQFSHNFVKSVPLLCGMYVFDERREIQDSSTLVLKHFDNALTFEMSGMNYLNPSRTYYRYMLQGYDRMWTELCTGPGPARVSYSKLRPGKYSFYFYTGSDGHWSNSPRIIPIRVLRNPWFSIPMLVLYALLVVSGACVLVGRIVKYGKVKEEEKRRADVDKMKMRFFTNVSHELRTPLTLILSPLESILKDSNLTGSQRDKLVIMERNAKSLLGLVNQLLDFRRLESGKERLIIRRGRVDLFIEDIYSRFLPEAERRGMDYRIFLNDEIFAEYDAEKLRKILVNLLSNAFKFTNDEGKISVEVSRVQADDGVQEMIQIRVSDNGIGIPQEDIGHIFERFYQVRMETDDDSPGTGIGLNIVKEYVDMMGGSINVRSDSGKGAEFTIVLATEFCPDGEKVVEEITDECDFAGEKGYTILVVDDNDDFRHYLADELKSRYYVLEASDGNKAFSEASSHKVDLIVSDVMMPDMDGLEMCRKIRNSLATSHIPIILLSAKVTDDDKMCGFEAGANEYVEKPFNMEILLMRINALIRKRDERIRLFNVDMDFNAAGITSTSIDADLLRKAVECVQRNISNSDFSVEALSSELSMHRMTLYRKLVSITGLNPTLFIRAVRLKYAAGLLRGGLGSIAEAAYQSGFNSARLFSKYFKEQFGLLPSQYVENVK